MIGVIGDFIVDHYIFGTSHRISPEAPVPVVNVFREEDRAGGAGNVVLNLAGLGGKVLPIGVIGEVGKERLLKLLKGIETDGIFVDRNRETIIKSRVIVGNHQLVRVDREQIQSIDRHWEEEILKFLEKNRSRLSLLLLSDYGKGVLTPRLTSAIIKFANRHGIKTIIDPKQDWEKYKNGWLLKPNRKELGEAVGYPITDDLTLRQAGWELKERLNLDYLLVTLSEEGMALFGEQFQKIPTLAREVYDVTGAGDTVLAALGYSLERGESLESAIHFANGAAAVAIGKIGSVVVRLGEVMEFQKRIENSVDYKIVSFEKIGKLAQELKREGKRIVFTNGCFDLLHYGHVKYLQQAKGLGDVLIVGLNSDLSVRKLKGKERPINSQYHRAYLLASLEVVDFVVIFEEKTPYRLIEVIKPSILVKGGDYRNKPVVGRDLVEQVELIDYIEGHSTTSLIEKIRQKGIPS